MTPTAPYDDLDPGIRQLVRLLNEHGFETTDSGDGKSKFDAEGNPLPGWESTDGIDCVLNAPHVAIHCEPAKLIEECDRVHALLVEAGGFETLPRSISVQGDYEPGVTCHIFVMGFDDTMLVATNKEG
jgi:hypothetical protein